MQRPSEEKRRKILDAAAALFAEKPFHDVRLDDVALAARVGKGTLYIYFTSKEDLFDELLVSGFEAVLGRVQAHAEDPNIEPWDAMAGAVSELVDWAITSPHFYRLLHAEEQPATPRLRVRRREFGEQIEKIINRGIASGDFIDTHPELTAQFLPSCVRGAIRFGPEKVDAQLVKSHILRIFGSGIRANALMAPEAADSAAMAV